MISEEFDKLLASLDYHQALSILRTLGTKQETRSDITTQAHRLFNQIDEDREAENLFSELNSLDVYTLWNNSGDGYDGYHDSGEVAYDMLQEVVERYRINMRKYRELKIKSTEEKYFHAIIKGLCKYRDEGTNEFKDWVPDDPDTLISDEFYNWCKLYPNTDRTELEKSLGIYVEPLSEVTLEDYVKGSSSKLSDFLQD